MEAAVSQMLRAPNEAQMECLDVLLKGMNILAILPTGLGKSEMVFMYLELMMLVSFDSLGGGRLLSAFMI